VNKLLEKTERAEPSAGHTSGETSDQAEHPDNVKTEILMPGFQNGPQDSHEVLQSADRAGPCRGRAGIAIQSRSAK